MPKLIAFTSNCFGEDRSAALIACELRNLLKDDEEFEVGGASLISDGGDYTRREISLLFSSSIPPSGGFPTRSIHGFFQDLASGGIANVFRFQKTLRKFESSILCAVVVGDVPLLFLTRCALRKIPIIFLSLPKSDYIEPHYPIEEWYIRRSCDALLTRDAFTAENFKRKGLQVNFLGNPIVDELDPVPTDFLWEPGIPTVGILPGSREEAYHNLFSIAGVALRVSQARKTRFLAALPSTLAEEEIAGKAVENGWQIRKEYFTILSRENCDIVLTRGIFPNVLHWSDVVIGLAGTANEQAAALGKPVVAFTGTGPQTTRKRIEEQNRLLGEALCFAKEGPEEAAETVIRLLDQPEERTRRGSAGIERMGQPGASQAIARYLYDHYMRRHSS
jgi:uncharacterized protein (TIGR03492 family)